MARLDDAASITTLSAARVGGRINALVAAAIGDISEVDVFDRDDRPWDLHRLHSPTVGGCESDALFICSRHRVQPGGASCARRLHRRSACNRGLARADG